MVVDAASGTSANVVVNAVIRIGLKRIRPPSISASYTSIPRSRSCSTNVSSTIALVTTMPISSRNPISADKLSVRPVISSASSAPDMASGRLNTITNGVRSDPSVATITKYTSTIPAAIATKTS